MTPTYPEGRLRVPMDGNGMSATLSLTMSLAAASMKSTPMVLEMKGKERDARRLHSITITSLPLQMNWGAREGEVGAEG